MDAQFHVLSIDGPGLRVREHRKRRQHTKDKHGCFSCKQRRVKCDQRQPTCLRCERNSRECTYEDVTSSPTLSSDRAPSGPGASLSLGRGRSSSTRGSLLIAQPAATSMATILAESNIERLNPWVKEHSTSVDNLIHHFSSNSAVIMGQTFDPQLWTLACRYGFLVSTMLAVSACHLRHNTANPAPHQIAEMGQVSAAITTLKSALGQPLHKDRADALLCTAVMLNAVTFAAVFSESLTTSWVFSNSSDRLGWLDLQIRFKKLEQATVQFRESSLQHVLDTADKQAPATSEGEETTREGVPEAWTMLIGDKDEPNWHLYHEPVQALAELRCSEPHCHNSFAYIGFVKTLEEGFRDLLFDRDLRALWIIGYWLGLLGRLQIWWCSRRVQRDWAAVLCFLREKKLEQRPGEEGRMWRALIADLSVASEWPSPKPESF